MGMTCRQLTEVAYPLSHFPPFRHSSQWPGTDCWGSRPQT